MELTFRPIKHRPPTWRESGARRPTSPFRAGYDQTLRELRYELSLLKATEAFIQVEVEEVGLRQDGQLRANTQPTHPGVIVTAVTRELGTLTWPAEAFSHWQGNLRAVAKGLNHLRTLDRYGIAVQGQQYAGFAELGAGTAMGGESGFTRERAAELLAAEANRGFGDEWVTADYLLGGDETAIGRAYRDAARLHHPDAGGNADMFRLLTEARDLLLGGRS